MSSVIEEPQAARVEDSVTRSAVPSHPSKTKHEQLRRGLLYALPDWVMIVILFFVPIVLLVIMACSRWTRMDGASTWRIFRSVTLPLMKPTIVMCLVYCVTGSILAFDQFFILTKGGPNNSTMTVVELIYNFAFDSKKDLGMAAALSLLVLVALVIINSIQMRGMRDNTK